MTRGRLRTLGVLVALGLGLGGFGTQGNGGRLWAYDTPADRTDAGATTEVSVTKAETETDAPKTDSKNNDVSDSREVSFSLRSSEQGAEACWAFHPPIPPQIRGNLARSVHLVDDKGASVPLDEATLDITPESVCVLGLEPRQRYRLSLKGVRGSSGRMEIAPFTQTFTTPAKPTSLAFGTSQPAGALWTRVTPASAFTALTLEAVNVGTARLEVFRFEDVKAISDIARQAALAYRAPSESLVFSRERGHPEGQSEVVFAPQLDALQKVSVAWPTAKGQVQPGFYFLAARSDDQDTDQPLTLPLMAGQWLLVSTFRLTVMESPEGWSVLAEPTTDGRANTDTGVTPGVRLVLVDDSGKTLADDVTDALGRGMLKVSPDHRGEARRIVGIASDGSWDVRDLVDDRPSGNVSAGITARLLVSASETQPGGRVGVMVVARGKEGRPAPWHGTLKLAHPNGAVLQERDVVATAAMPWRGTLTVPLFAKGGTWSLRVNDDTGHEQARASLAVVPKSGSVRTHFTATSPANPEDGLTLTVRATKGLDARPVAWKTGRVFARSAPSPTDEGEESGAAFRPLASFLTDANGEAKLKLPWPRWTETDEDSEENAPPIQALSLKAQLESQDDGEVITVAARTSGPKGRLTLPFGAPEETTVPVDIALVDDEGQSHAASNLWLHLYEEGRNFAWYIHEGRWAYHLLPQRRRVMGIPFDVPVEGSVRLQVPLATGRYVLEVADKAGHVLARKGFSTERHRDVFPSENPHGMSVAFVAPHAVNAKGSPNGALALRLKAPARVALWVMDGEKTRQVERQILPAGASVIPLTFQVTEERRAVVRAHALFQDGSTVQAATTFDTPLAGPGLTVTPVMPQDALVAGEEARVPLTLRGLKKATRLSITGLVSFESDDARQTTLSPVLLTPLALKGAESATLTFPVPVEARRVHLALWAESGTRGVPVVGTFSARPPRDMRAEVLTRLREGDRVVVTVTGEGPLARGTAVRGGVIPTLTVSSGLMLSSPSPVPPTRRATLEARSPGWGEVTGTLRGQGVPPASGGGLRSREAPPRIRVWPVEVLPARGTASPWGGELTALAPDTPVTLPFLKSGPRRPVLVGPALLPSTLDDLRTLSEAEPLTTAEVAGHLVALRLWKGPLVESGILPLSAWAFLTDTRRISLLQRQNLDGSFGALAPDSPGDLVATAFALEALGEEDSESAARAVAWLRARLENAWFSEEDHEPRALAFAALAARGQADKSALTYLNAANEGTKKLHAVAQAALASALGNVGEDALAKARVQSALKALADEQTTLSDGGFAFWHAAALLAAAPSLAPEDLGGVMSKMSLVRGGKGGLAGTFARLRALAAFAARRGGDSWSVMVNGTQRTPQGPALALTPGSTTSLRAEGPAGGLSVLASSRQAPSDEGPTLDVKVALLRLDGSPLASNTPLQRGEVMALVLSGPSPGKAGEAFQLVYPTSGGLEPVDTSRLESSALAEFAPGLPKALTPWSEVVITPTAFGGTLKPGGGTWRVVILLRATLPGEFTLPPPRLRGPDGTRIPLKLVLPKVTVRG